MPNGASLLKRTIDCSRVRTGSPRLLNPAGAARSIISMSFAFHGVMSCSNILSDRKIGTALHYPIPLHLQPAFTHLGYREGDLPVTERLTSEILSLPMFPQIRPDQLEQVAEALSLFCKSQNSTGKLFDKHEADLHDHALVLRV